MRIIFYSALLFSSFFTTKGWAQDYMHIKKRDGTTQIISLKSIEKLTFGGLITATTEERAIAVDALQHFNLFPNPASNQFVLNFELSESSPVSMELYDENGSLVKIIDKGILEKGAYQHLWETSAYPNGLYVCKIITKKGIEPKKIIINK